MSKGTLTIIILGALNILLILIFLTIIYAVNHQRQKILNEQKLENPKVIVTRGFINNVTNNYLIVQGIADEGLKYPQIKALIDNKTIILKNNKKTANNPNKYDLVEIYLKKQLIEKQPIEGTVYKINIITEDNSEYNSHLAKMSFYNLALDIKQNIDLEPSIIKLKYEQTHIIKNGENKDLDIKNIDVYKISYKFVDKDFSIDTYISKQTKKILGTINHLEK